MKLKDQGVISDFKNGLKLKERNKEKVDRGSVADFSKDWFFKTFSGRF